MVMIAQVCAFAACIRARNSGEQTPSTPEGGFEGNATRHMHTVPLLSSWLQFLWLNVVEDVEQYMKTPRGVS
jgi:hypothetical protein